MPLALSKQPVTPALMAWCVGWLLVGVWACLAGGVPRPSPPRPGCDVEALRCDVISSFPDLGFHCTRCARRRPMRFGKRGGNAAPPHSISSLLVPDAPRVPASPASAPPQLPDASDGLRLIGRPHLFLSKIFWRNIVEENVWFREKKLRLWRARKKCSLSPDDPARCLQENFLTKLFGTTKDHDRFPNEAGESNESLCAINPRKCPQGTDNFQMRPYGNDRSMRQSLNDLDHSERSQSNAGLSNRSHSRGERIRDSDKHKRHRNYSAKSPERFNLHNGDHSSTDRRRSFNFGRRRSRRSVVEEVVEGLMEMLHLEVLPVNPKHYGCHDLPFPGLE